MENETEPTNWYKFGYSKKPNKFTCRCFYLWFYIAAIIWFCAIAFLSIVAVGYESQPLITTDFNGTYKLWYEKFLVQTPWIAKPKVCQGEKINVDDSVATNSSFGAFSYAINGFVDHQIDEPIDGLLYQNYALQNCSIRMIYFTQINQPTTEIQGNVACNTSASQWIAMDISRDNPQPLGLNNLPSYTEALGYTSATAPLDLQSTILLWEAVLLDLLGAISPVSPIQGTSILFPILAANNLSSFSMFYNDSSQTSINSPANDYWTLYIQYTTYQSNSTSGKTLSITFDTAKAQVDFSRTSKSDYLKANTLLKPTFDLLPISDPTIFWQLVNWLIVGYYWTILNDLGQTSPTIYAPIPPQPLPNWYQLNFSQATLLPPTNNIFVNETLFGVYFDILNTTILPYLNLSTPNFTSISHENQLKPRIVTFVRSYTCQVRRWKSILEAAVSIGESIYVLNVAAFAIFIFFASIFQNRRDRDRGADLEASRVANAPLLPPQVDGIPAGEGRAGRAGGDEGARGVLAGVAERLKKLWNWWKMPAIVSSANQPEEVEMNSLRTEEPIAIVEDGNENHPDTNAGEGEVPGEASILLQDSNEGNSRNEED